MKCISLFAGIGGFDLALTRLGHEVVYANEWDKYAVQTYEKNFTNIEWTGKSNDPRPNQHNDHSGLGKVKEQCRMGNGRIDTRDITTVPTSDIPDHDLLVGGFPCQAFSIAGKRRGFLETRGTLFFDIARILKDKKPRLFVLENVKGLLSHDNGSTFKTIISTLDELGYDLQWQVLNSKNFGVPQNRERVFIVGHLRGTSRPEVFPFTGNNSETIKQLNDPKHSNDRVYESDGLSPTLNTMQGGNRQPFVVAQRGRYPENPTARIAGLPTEQMLEPNLNGVSNTLSTVQKDNMLCVDTKIRRLTPTECERLQGFPDGWTKGVSDTQRYKQLGNAVTVNVVEAIIGRL